MKNIDVNRICDGIQEGKMSRREIHKVLGAVGFGLAVVPLSTGAKAEEIAAASCGGGNRPDDLHLVGLRRNPFPSTIC